MSFRWTNDLETGLSEIDAQHKSLIDQFNRLIDACSRKKGHEEIGRLLTFLTDYVDLHFAAEERAMAECSYEQLPSHREEHTKYREKLAKLVAAHRDQGTNDEVVAETVWIAAKWFIEHVRQTDLAMVAAIRKG